MKTEITKHPLRDCYMLYITNNFIPPYFGSLKSCKKARVALCNNVINYCIDLCKSTTPTSRQVDEMIEFVNDSLDVINENKLIDLLIYRGYQISYNISQEGVIINYFIRNTIS